MNELGLRCVIRKKRYTSFNGEVGRIAPIGLDELAARAALLTRIDRKYVLPVERLGGVLAAVPDETRVLEVDGNRETRYGSVYFDTPDLLSYRLAARGRRRRFKLRTRHYGSTDSAYLEMKTRGMRGVTRKERILSPAHAVSTLTPAGRAFAADTIVALGLDPRIVDDMSAVLSTGYVRTTLLLPEHARATIDTSLVWQDARGRTLERPGLVIVETKSSSRASYVDRLLWRARIRPARISKFATGMAALDTSLPANRWNRVLRTHFTPTDASDHHERGRS